MKIKLKIFGKEFAIDCGCDLRKVWITKWWNGLNEGAQKRLLGRTFAVLGWMVTIDNDGNIRKIKPTKDVESAANKERVEQLQREGCEEYGHEYVEAG